MARTSNPIVALSIIAGLVVISLTIVQLTSIDATSSPDPGDRRTAPRTEEASRLPEEVPAPTPKPAAKSPDPVPDPPPGQDELEQDELRRALQHKFGRPLNQRDDHAQAEAEHEQPVLPPASWSLLPEEYVTGIVREQLIPVAQSCYEDIAPNTNGALTLSVAILGDSELGGVIDQIDVNHTATSIAGELAECVRLAAYDMEFDPPEQGQGLQEFDFTIEFSKD